MTKGKTKKDAIKRSLILMKTTERELRSMASARQDELGGQVGKGQIVDDFVRYFKKDLIAIYKEQRQSSKK